MYYSDLVPEELVSAVFQPMTEQTLTQCHKPLDIKLIFTHVDVRKEDPLKISAVFISIEDGKWLYEIRVPHMLVDFLTRYFFCLAHDLENINGIALTGSRNTTARLPMPAEDDEKHRKLLLVKKVNEVSDDLKIDGDRIELFLDFMDELWAFLLYHETAHITHGHLRFVSQGLSQSNPSYSRAMEFDADRTAVIWSKSKIGVNLPVWKAGVQALSRATSINPHFIAFVVSNMFAATRSYFGNGSDNYLPNEIRHFWAITRILDGSGFGFQDEADLAIKYLAESTDLMMKVAGHDQLQKPTLIMDIDLRGQIDWFGRVSKEYSTLRSDWAKYAFLADPSS